MTNEKLVKAYQNGDKEAMSTIVDQNRGLVCMVVNSFYNSLENSYLDRDDLEQIGYMGLMEAVKHFDGSMGFKFSSYASKAIMGYITRGLRTTTPWEKRSDTSGRMAQVISADSLLPGSESMTYLETIEDPEAENDFHNMICAIDQEILRNDIKNMLSRVFSDKENVKDAITLHFGLNGQNYTYGEIADIYQAPYGRVASWITDGLRRVRRSKAGIELKRKYQLEYDLAPRVERLTRLEYKDPAHYVEELERLRKECSIA